MRFGGLIFGRAYYFFFAFFFLWWGGGAGGAIIGILRYIVPDLPLII